MAGIFQPEISEASAPPGYRGNVAKAAIGNAIANLGKGLGDLVSSVGSSKSKVDDYINEANAIKDEADQKGYSPEHTAALLRKQMSSFIERNPGSIDEVKQVSGAVTGIDLWTGAKDPNVAKADAETELENSPEFAGIRETIKNDPANRNPDGSLNEEAYRLSIDQAMFDYKTSVSQQMLLERKLKVLSDSNKLDDEVLKAEQEVIRPNYDKQVSDSISMLANEYMNGKAEGKTPAELSQLLGDEILRLKTAWGNFSPDGQTRLTKEFIDERLAPLTSLQESLKTMDETTLRGLNIFMKEADANATKVFIKMIGPLGGSTEGKNFVVNSSIGVDLATQIGKSPALRQKAERYIKTWMVLDEDQPANLAAGGLVDNSGAEPGAPIVDDETAKQIARLDREERQRSGGFASEAFFATMDKALFAPEMAPEAYKYMNTFMALPGDERVKVATVERIFGSEQFATLVDFAVTNPTPEGDTFLKNTTTFLTNQAISRRENIKDEAAGLFNITGDPTLNAFASVVNNTDGTWDIVFDLDGMSKGGFAAREIATAMQSGGAKRDLEGNLVGGKGAYENSWDGFTRLIRENPRLQSKLHIIPAHAGFKAVQVELEQMKTFQNISNTLPPALKPYFKETVESEAKLKPGPQPIVLDDNPSEVDLEAADSAPDGTPINVMGITVIKGSADWNAIFSAISESQ